MERGGALSSVAGVSTDERVRVAVRDGRFAVPQGSPWASEKLIVSISPGQTPARSRRRAPGWRPYSSARSSGSSHSPRSRIATSPGCRPPDGPSASAGLEVIVVDLLEDDHRGTPAAGAGGSRSGSSQASAPLSRCSRAARSPRRRPPARRRGRPRRLSRASACSDCPTAPAATHIRVWSGVAGPRRGQPAPATTSSSSRSRRMAVLAGRAGPSAPGPL